MKARRDPNRLSEDLKMYRGLHHVNDFYVSLSGNDKWSGTMPDANAQRSDGPFRTLARACQQVVRHPTPGPVTIHLRAGIYEMDEPLRFAPGQADGVRFAAYNGEKAVLEGGRRIEGWRADSPGGVTVWTADLPELGSVLPYFRQLFVNGRRATRARFPKKDTFRMESVPETPLQGFMAGPPSDCFVSAPGDMREWRNLTDVDVVAFHYWNEERLPVVSFDPQTRMVRCSRKSAWPLKDDAAFSADQHRDATNKMVRTETYSPADMAALGYDRHSVYADPRFRDISARNFALLPDSPASALGMTAPDFRDIGPRCKPGAEQW